MENIFENFDTMEIDKIKETNMSLNKNYIRVLNKIPKHFKLDNDLEKMILAFNYGEMIGRKCEKDTIEWNAFACFQTMKMFYKLNGKLPQTQQELQKWKDSYLS